MTGHDHRPEADEPLDETQRAVRALLQGEGVDVDEARRETAISAALDAASPSGAGATGALGTTTTTGTGAVTALTRARRRPGRDRLLRPVLVAAAVVAVVGVGAVALIDTTTGSHREDAALTTASADDASGARASSGADPGIGTDAAGSAPADGSTPEERAQDEAGAPATTAATASAGGVALGEFADVDALLDAVTTGTFAADSAGPSAGSSAESPPAGALPDARCTSRLATTVTVATASVAGEPVVVVSTGDPSSVVVLRTRDCVELARR